MKTSCLALLLLMLTLPDAVGQMGKTTQPQKKDSLWRSLRQTRHDTSRVLLLVELASIYRFLNPDSSLILAQQALGLAQRLDFDKGKMRALNTYGEARRFRGEFPQALEAQLEALQISKNINDKEGESALWGTIGLIYLDLNEYRQALHYLYQAKKINKTLSYRGNISLWLSGIGYAYERLNRLDSALFFQEQARAFLGTREPGPLGSLVLTRLGGIKSKLGHFDQALRHFQDAIRISYVTGDLLNRGRTQYRIAELYYTAKQPDSSLHYARLTFANGKKVSQKTIVLDASSLLVKLYKANNNLDSAFHYQNVAMATKDSLYGREKFQRLQVLALSEQQRQQELIAVQKEYQNKIWLYALLAGLGVLILLAVILWRSNQQKQKSNTLLHRQKAEIETQRDQTDQALAELKATQTQLIQKEKMASLGELTAGIAHEIQNPLNFVTNFSEVSAELVDELDQEAEAGNTQGVKAITEDLKQNLQKITQHGQRASSIVRGMLEHSRTTTGERQTTDLNALADEYLRLAYHGLWAKDKNFNAELKTDFDPALGQVEVVPQEIGRVLLNLFNNAFYAISERQKQAPTGYLPTVSLRTQHTKEHVEIRVTDNGIGIPESVRTKIFQPFFTTKPTGQGTGLGLSLSYDIITKGHGGELKVNTQEGEYSEFVIQLPIHLSGK